MGSKCINAGNSFHRCSDFCYKKMSVDAASNPYNVEDFPPLQRNNTNVRKEKSIIQPSAPLRVAKSGREAWSSLFSVGRSIQQDSKCSYFPPKEIPSGKAVPWIPKEAVSANVAKWGRTLAGYVVGDKPFYSHLRACVHRLWRPKGNLQVHSRENGFFFFVFELEEDCSRVLQGGPWMFDKRVIVLRRWTPELTMDRDLLSSIPVWVRFPDLPLKFWSTDCISIIASAIGKPLFVDNATASGERYSYARCFVEVDAKTKLQKSIEVAVEGEENATIKAEYENLPPSCSTCECFGHSFAHCPFKKVWVEKSKAAPVADENVLFTEDIPTGGGQSDPIDVEIAAVVPDGTVLTGTVESGGPSTDGLSEDARVDDPDNVGNVEEEEDAEYENEWMEDMDDDATMANEEWEEELRRLAPTSKIKKRLIQIHLNGKAQEVLGILNTVRIPHSRRVQ